MKAVFLLLLFSLANASDPLDIVSSDSVLYVAWSTGLRIWGTATELVFTEDADVTLGIASLGGGDVLLLTRCHDQMPDSLFMLDPVTLGTVSVRQVLPEHLAELSIPSCAEGGIRLARHQPSEGSFYLSGDPVVVLAGYRESNAVSARFQYDPSEGLIITDTLGTRRYSNYSGMYYGLTGPVSCGGSLPMVFWTYYETYYNAILTTYAGIHLMNGDPVPGDYEPILFDSIYHAEGVFTEGEIRCSGTSVEEIVVLWTKESGDRLVCTVFDGTGVIPFSSGPLLFISDPEAIMSLSRYPADPGMLVVWECGSGMLCRYRENGSWNPWTYTIEPSPGPVMTDALRVCGVPEGYFVSWLAEGADVPEVRYVPRSVVTSINENGQPVESCLEVFPNPCGRSLSVNAGGFTAPVSVSVLDLQGRVLITVPLSADGTALVNTEGIHSGTYIVQVVGEGICHAVKAAVLPCI